jgi:hypothetical protein
MWNGAGSRTRRKVGFGPYGVPVDQGGTSSIENLSIAQPSLKERRSLSLLLAALENA